MPSSLTSLREMPSSPIFGVLVVLLATITLTLGVPPPPPIVCKDEKHNADCTLSPAYAVWPDRSECTVGKVVYPRTEKDILDAVAEGVRTNLHMKVVSGFSHTIPKWSCPNAAANDTNTLLISTRFYTARILIDKASKTVTVDSGVGLRELLDALAKEDLALAAAPYWDGVSIGGLISTGSHGSSLLDKGAALHDYILSMTLVVPASQSQGYSKVVCLTQGNPDFDAAKVSLGILGVISTVTLSVEPMFKRTVTNIVAHDDGDIQDRFVTFGNSHDFPDITWYPSLRKVVYKSDDRAPLSAHGDGVNDFIGFRSTPVPVVAAIRAAETSTEASRNGKEKCEMAKVIVASKLALANGLKNNGLLFTGYPVVGLQHKMQTSGSCSRSPEADFVSRCSWDPRIKGLFFYESTFVFTFQKARDFLEDVKTLRDMVGTERMCGVDVYNGFLIRFVKRSDAYLGHVADSVVMDMNYYRAEHEWMPRLDEDIWEEVEQMALLKHGAAPHWAKNRNLAFLNVSAKYPRLDKFRSAMKRLDPKRLFSSEWSDTVVVRNGEDKKPKRDGCALEGVCICSDDSHCAPSRGYFCRPGVLFKDARVCRYEADEERLAS